MTRALRTFGAFFLIVMTMSSAFMPLAIAAGSFTDTFSDGTARKVLSIPEGGGDNSSVYLTLRPNETIKQLDLTVSPKLITYNRSLVFPMDEGFQSGNYSDKYLLADNTGLTAQDYSFKRYEYFDDSEGVDLSKTNANLLFNEGLVGVALGANKTANITNVFESSHLSGDTQNYDWGGRLIKNLTVNISGNANVNVGGGVRAWNSQTRVKDFLFTNWALGASISHVTMVQQNYTVPIYSKLTLITNVNFNGVAWINTNVTYEGFYNKSTVTSVPINTVKQYGWDPSWNVGECKLDAVRDLPSSTYMSFELTPDNGTTWEPAQIGASHVFAKQGNIVRWRANLSADIANVTPVLKSVILMCQRNSEPGDYTWQSRTYHIDEGAITYYSVYWEGMFPTWTGMRAVAQRWPKDSTTELNNGDSASFQYDPTLHNLSLKLVLIPYMDQAPHLTKVIFTYWVEVHPSDVAIDVGNDGTIEWSTKGELNTDNRIYGPNATAMTSALNSKVPHSGTSVNVPLRVISSTGASVKLQYLKIEYGLPPELKTRIGMISLNEDTNRTAVLSLEDHFTDDYDTNNLTYSVSYMDAPQHVLATLRGPLLDVSVPTPYWNGPSMIRVRATDRDGTSTESNDITVMVWPVDEPPVITYVPSDIPAYVGANFLGSVKAFDPEGRNLTYHLDMGAPDAAIDTGTGLFSWRPVTNQTQTFIVNVSDNLGSSYATFNLTPVQDPTKASPPVFVTVPLISTKVGENYWYDAKAVDLDGDTLEFQLGQHPDGMTVDARSGKVQWWPTVAQLGYKNVTLRVTDGVFVADQDFRVLVVNTATYNKPPLIMSTPPDSAWVAKPYIYQIKAKDPDAGTVLWYELATGPKTMSLDDGGRILWIPTANDIGSQSVKVFVNDGVVQVPQEWTISIYSTDRTCIISTPAPNTVIKDKVQVKGLATGPTNITRVEVRIGDENNWMKATGTNKWHLELNTSNLGTGYHYVRARACDDVTCSKESEVRFYHQGSGSSLGSGISVYWYAVILVIIIIVVVLLIDLKMKFIKGPRDKIKMDNEDLELEDNDRSVYHNKDR